MNHRRLLMCGFPESGKTTYLAALWHLVSARTNGTALRFHSLGDGDASHLNALAKRWRDGLTQLRTDIATNRLVSMNLQDGTGEYVRLTFPDLSGESYRAMFEERECTHSLADLLTQCEGMLFCVHADRIQQPQFLVDVAAQSRALGAPIPEGQDIPWSPTLAPTQVRIVDLLQVLRAIPLEVPFRRVAFILSAWDKVADEGRTPTEFLAERLPLLNQYLESGADAWIHRVYGVSAQGTDYEKENEQLTPELNNKLQRVRELDEPSMRISVVVDGSNSCDLTEPTAWLIS